MMQDLQNLQFTILVALVLEHLFDGDTLPGLRYCGFENDSEGAITNNFLCVVGHTL